MNSLSKIRRKISIEFSRRLAPNKFTVISDDCWGGQLYRQLKLPYFTPTVGLWIKPEDYLRYLQGFYTVHKENLIFMETDRNYPVATLSGIEINFMHYASKEEAEQKYFMRYQRIQGNRLFTKIDFGKYEYTIADIYKWNELRLENSVAFYPVSIDIPREGIHNGVLVPDWHLDGAMMFDITLKYFDAFKWIRTGKG